MEQALQLKQQGNKAFSQGNKQLAIKYYSDAIEANNQEPSFYSNRAQVYIVLEEYAKAIEDSNSALAIDSAFSRAYFRKATAYFEEPMKAGAKANAIEAVT
jgi:serine/threonine-protein phosphatase 5